MKNQIAFEAQYELVNNETGEVVVLTYAQFMDKFGGKHVANLLKGEDKTFTFAPVPVSKPAPVTFIYEAPEEPIDESAPVAPATPSKKVVELEAEGKPTGIVDLILEMHMNGLKNSEIIKLGFAAGTVNRQVSEFKKRLENSGLAIQF